MTILFEENVNVDFNFDFELIAKSVIDKALNSEKFPYEVEISLTFVNAQEIREINKNFRDIDRETDVLSFPLIEYNTLGDYEFIEDDLALQNPDTGDIMLGDIVLCIDKVKSQAKLYGHSEKREYAFLIAHSMLHLLGYDHIDDSDRIIMENKQDEILNSLNITRN